MADDLMRLKFPVVGNFEVHVLRNFSGTLMEGIGISTRQKYLGNFLYSNDIEYLDELKHENFCPSVGV